MQKLFPEEGRIFTLISDQIKKVIQEQGNVEAFELLELTDKIQRTLHLVTSTAVPDVFLILPSRIPSSKIIYIVM